VKEKKQSENGEWELLGLAGAGESRSLAMTAILNIS